jgi:transposase
MKRIFIGIDISKEWLDYAICSDKKVKVFDSERVNNDVEGINLMCRMILKAHSKDQVWFCFEHTGNYGLLLSSILQSKNLTYTAVSAMEIKKSMGIVRGKSDVVDAARIAQYAAVNVHKLRQTQLPAKELMQIKNSLSYRTQLVKIKTQLENSLGSYKLATQVVELDYIVDDLNQKIKSLKEDIKLVDQKIQEYIHANEELSNSFKLVTSVKGIGMVIAAFMIVYSNNFTSFEDARKFNCFTGIAPFENSSGKSIKPAKTSHYRHKHLKTLIFNGANSAAMYDPQLKKYYNKKRAEGKKHLTVINAIACKITARAFATIRRNTPYVNFSY